MLKLFLNCVKLINGNEPILVPVKVIENVLAKGLGHCDFERVKNVLKYLFGDLDCLPVSRLRLLEEQLKWMGVVCRHLQLDLIEQILDGLSPHLRRSVESLVHLDVLRDTVFLYFEGCWHF